MCIWVIREFGRRFAVIWCQNNYRYNEIGQLAQDVQEEIDTIIWRVDGKIKEIERTSGSSKKNLKFRYDPMGNRLAKEVYDSNDNWEYTLWYFRDAQGNVLSTYSEWDDDGAQESHYQQIEKVIYGMERIGMRVDTTEVLGAIGPEIPEESSQNRWHQRYELKNHLGNVMVTVSGHKVTIPEQPWTLLQIDEYRANVISAQDYYPFGAPMTERNYISEDYRYGFQGQEKVDEIKGNGNHYTAEYWEMDPRLGRRWNTDPIVKPHESPYAVFANNPIWFVDPSGADTSFADNQSREEFVDTYNSVNEGIEKYDKKINKKMDKWAEKGYDRKGVNRRMSRRIERLNKKRSQLLEIKESFDEVIESDVMYFYTARPNPGGKYISGGGTKYNTSEDRVDIWFYSGNTGTLVQETRHGAGYSWGEWGWDATKNSPTNYDYQDEYDAYRQESNYNRLINAGIGRSKIQIKKVIQDHYGGKDYIIKEYRQHFEPNKPCK